MNRIRSNLSFANAISLLALFVALGGTGYAAAVAKNSVGHKQIRKSAVRASEIKDRAVGTSEVRDGSLLAGDFKAGEIPAGPKGDKGDTGTFGTVTTQFQQATVALADNTSASYNAFCPAGQRGIGGGARGDATDSEFTNVTSSRPAISLANTEPPADGGTFTGWRITVQNPTGGAPPGGAILPEVWVICAAP